MDEAIKTVLTLVGAGGLTTIILGVLGFLKGRPSRGPEQPQSGMMFAALYADRASIDRMSLALERHGDTLDRQTDAIKDHTEAFRDRTQQLMRNR